MKAGIREGVEPRCPFCNSKLERPKEINIGPADTAQGGVCSCGAVFIADPTGKNVGEIMAQALASVADRLSKEVRNLTPDEDYEDAVMRYDFRTHRSAGLDSGYMDGYGRLYIIRAKKNAG